MQLQTGTLKVSATILVVFLCQTFSFSVPTVLAQSSSNQQDSQHQPSQNVRLYRFCPSLASTAILRVKTEHYWVSICSSKGEPKHPKYYVAQEINSSNLVTLPLSIYPLSNEDLKIYTAQNGKYLYTLNFDAQTTQCSHGCLMITLPDGKHSFEAVLPDKP